MSNIITNPPAYITVAAFRAMANDYDLTVYTDQQLQDILNRASGTADGIMKKSYLAQERTIRYIGNGSNQLNLRQRPLLYIKRCQIVVPGSAGLQIPVNQLLIDYDAGSVLEYTPLLYQGQGYFAQFPQGIPVDFTLAYGYGLAVAQPTWTSADATGNGLTPGQYDIAVTAKTMYGETTAVSQTVTTATGAILLTINPVLGAYVYRAYIAPHGTTPLKLSAESAFTTYGGNTLTISVNSLTPTNGVWQDTLPASDTSAPDVPWKLTEAVRLLALDSIYEQNNLSNRGVYKTESGRKSVMWRSTEGNSGKGSSFTQQRAEALLRGMALQAIY